MFWTLAIYEWLCILSGIWYARNRRKNNISFTGRDWEFEAGLFSVAIVWWYWPLMIMYLVGEKKAKEKADMDKIRRAG